MQYFMDLELAYSIKMITDDIFLNFAPNIDCTCSFKPSS